MNVTSHFLRCCVAVVAMSASIASAQDLADVAELAEKSVVRINVKTEDGGATGSGYLVDNKGTIVTNCHVIAGAISANVVFSNKATCEVEGTYFIDQNRDIAIIKITPPPETPYLKVANQLPRKGETVTAIGAPHGLDFTVTRGIVSAIRTSEQLNEELGDGGFQGTWLQVDVAISSGNSGGPLLDSRGQVIGMSTMVLTTGQNLNFGISSVDIADALRKAQSQKVVALTSGAAKTKMREPSTGIGGAPPVPMKAINDYIAVGKRDYDKLVANLKADIVTENAELKLLRTGDIQTELESVAGFSVEAGKLILPSGKYKWMFTSERVKQERIEKQVDLCKEMARIFQTVKATKSQSTLTELLCNAGPELDTRREKNIGFARGMIFLATLDEGLAIVIYEKNPYFAVLNSSAGLFPGDVLLPTAMYVQGTVTGKYEDRAMTLTILQQVSRDQIESALSSASSGSASSGSSASTNSGSSSSSSAASNSDALSAFEGEFESVREWKSKSGHTVRATLISKTSTHVKLRIEKTNKELEIAIDDLSDGDKKYVRK
jgi:S1-C subfamily serine protease